MVTRSADKFPGTPDTGVNDLFAAVKYEAGNWNLTGVYHDFSAEGGNADWERSLICLPDAPRAMATVCS